MNNMKVVSARSAAIFLAALTGAFGVSKSFAAGDGGSGKVHRVYLAARAFDQTMPGGEVVRMWGFVEDSDSRLSTYCGEEPTVPGPMITVPSDRTKLRIDLRNDLDVPISLMIPGLSPKAGHTPERFVDSQGRERVRSFRAEINPAQKGKYEWGNVSPGTYVYHSASHPAVQVQMGLYGGVKKDYAKRIAYGPPPNNQRKRGGGEDRSWRYDIDSNDRYDGYDWDERYDNEVVLFLSEIDPALHDAVAKGHYGTATYPSTMNYVPKYFLINGRAFPDSSPLVIGKRGEKVLVRALNMGLESHVPMLLGVNWWEIAQDGHAHPYPQDQYSTLLPAAKTKDLVVDIPEKARRGDKYPVFDRRLRLTNSTAPEGGMLAYLQVGRVDPDRDSSSMSRESGSRKSKCRKVGNWSDDND